MSPDFSGEWILNRQASRLGPGADTVQSAVWRIEHREPTFRHQASFMFANGSRAYEYEMQSDGREVIGTEEGARIVSTLRWEGSALTFTSRTQRPDGEMTISFRYELVDGGRVLRASEQARGTAWDQDNVWTFDQR